MGSHEYSPTTGFHAVTPDRSKIASAMAGFSNLFEAHSFAERGVMQFHAMDRAMAALIAGGGLEEVDLSPLAREHFAPSSYWVREELHI